LKKVFGGIANFFSMYQSSRNSDIAGGQFVAFALGFEPAAFSPPLPLAFMLLSPVSIERTTGKNASEENSKQHYRFDIYISVTKTAINNTGKQQPKVHICWHAAK